MDSNNQKSTKQIHNHCDGTKKRNIEEIEEIDNNIDMKSILELFPEEAENAVGKPPNKKSKMSVPQLLGLSLEDLSSLFEQVQLSTIQPFKKKNKTGLTLYKDKYVNGVKVFGPGPRNSAMIHARLNEHAFLFQWHIPYEYQEKKDYSRCFGSEENVIVFYQKHYSKYENIERNGYEYYSDTLRAYLAFDIEKYTLYVDGMDTNLIDQQVLDAACAAIYGTLQFIPQNGIMLCTPAHRYEQIIGHETKYWKTSFHLKHTGVKFRSVFSQKSFAYACVSYAEREKIPNFFYEKPEVLKPDSKNNKKPFKANEPVIDRSLYRVRGEFRMCGSCKKGKLNSCLLNPKYPVMNILVFIGHLYGDYITTHEARIYQKECNFSDDELLELFPEHWDEPNTMEWDQELIKNDQNFKKQKQEMDKRVPLVKNGKTIIDDAQFFISTGIEAKDQVVLKAWLDEFLLDTHPHYTVGNIRKQNDDGDDVVDDVEEQRQKEKNDCTYIYIKGGGDRTCPNNVQHTQNNAELIITKKGKILYKCYGTDCKSQKSCIIEHPIPDNILELLHLPANGKIKQKILFKDKDFQVDDTLIQENWVAQDDLRHFSFSHPGASYTELNTWLTHTIFKVNMNDGYVWHRKVKKNDKIQIDQLSYFPYTKKNASLPDTYYVMKNEIRTPVVMYTHFAELARRQVTKGYESIVFEPFCKPEDAPNPNVYNTFTGYNYPYVYQEPIVLTNEEWIKMYTEPDLIKKNPLFEQFFHLCGKNHEAFLYDVYFMAERLQKPKYRTRTFFSKTGPEGIGKDTQMKILRLLMGDKYVITYSRIEDLLKDFNAGDMATNLIVVLNEIEAANSHDKAGLLKFVTDQDERIINQKYKEAYKLKVYTQYYAINNGKSIWHFDGGKMRRIVSTKGENFHNDPSNPEDNAYWTRFYEWLDNDNNRRDFFNFLTNLDLTHFDSAARSDWMSEGNLTGIQESYHSVPIRFLAEMVLKPPPYENQHYPTFFDRKIIYERYVLYMNSNNYKYPLNCSSFYKFFLNEHPLETKNINIDRKDYNNVQKNNNVQNNNPCSDEAK